MHRAKRGFAPVAEAPQKSRGRPHQKERSKVVAAFDLFPRRDAAFLEGALAALFLGEQGIPMSFFALLNEGLNGLVGVQEVRQGFS